MKYLNIKQLYCLVILLMVSSCNVNNTQIVYYSKKGFENAPSKIIHTGYFEEIVNNAPYSIEYVQSKIYKVELKGRPSLLDSINISNQGKKLYLGMTPGDYYDVWLKVIVYAPYIKAIRLNGPGDIILGNINFDKNIKIIALGPGDIKADTIKCNFFELKSFGPGNVMVKKLKARSHKIKSFGPGYIDIN